MTSLSLRKIRYYKKYVIINQTIIQKIITIQLYAFDFFNKICSKEIPINNCSRHTQQ